MLLIAYELFPNTDSPSNILLEIVEFSPTTIALGELETVLPSKTAEPNDLNPTVSTPKISYMSSSPLFDAFNTIVLLLAVKSYFDPIPIV